ncbi:MAG: peptidylprolyl isomerase [Sedimentisphaerales bacterium]
MKIFRRLACIVLVLSAVLPMFASAQNNPVVVLETNCGNIFIELFPADAPVTVDNFLAYVRDGFYEYLLFHRVVQSDYFIIQGGGYYSNFSSPTTKSAIINESYNGLSNLRGTIAMARQPDPNSATSQFFINNKDNIFFDWQDANDVGYCVFGNVIDGLDVVDFIANVPTIDYYPTNPYDPFNNLPEYPIGILSASVLPCTLSYCFDLNADGKVNFEDFGLLASHWLDSDCNSANNFCGGGDFDYSGSVTAGDLSPFLEHWLGQLGFESTVSDFTNDGIVNFKDAAVFFAHWLDSACTPANNFCDETDLNHDGSVNFADFALFANNWLSSQ